MRELYDNKNNNIGLVIGDKTFKGKLKNFNVKAVRGNIGLGCCSLKQKKSVKIYGNCSGKLIGIYDGIIYDFKKKISKNHELVRTTDGDIILHLLEENYRGDLAFTAKDVLSSLEGGFAIAATDGRDVIAARDTVGFRTLYYGENENFYAFATLKKALWKIGVDQVFRLNAGNMVHINEKQLDISNFFKELRFGVKISIKDKDVAVIRYENSLNNAVEQMLKGVDKAGILLSSGVDSCLLAKMINDKASQEGTELIGYTVGFEGSQDLKFGEEFAKQIGLPFQKKTVTIDDLDRALPRVIKAVEERDYVQIETSLIPFIALEMATQDSIKVIFLGQGPDEMWGGYPWYPRLLKEWGYAKLHEVLWDDLIRADIETLQRENKVAQLFDIELRYPYLDIDVIKTAMSVAPQLKVISDKDDLGKYIHRTLAKKIGVPTSTAERVKIAAQHGSGIHQVLIQIAKRHGFDDNLVSKLNYLPSKISKEKLGSCSRYGYKYGDRDMWLIPGCVQLYFDYLAYSEGLLNENERMKISPIIRDCPN